MTTTRPVVEGLTCEEIHSGFDALIARVAELVAERDEARAAAAEARQERDQALSRADANARVAGTFRNDLDDTRTELRRTRDICRKLAVAKGALEQQIDHMQTQPEPRPDDHTLRWPFRRLGNQL
jgi:uncharacterized coiled-coil DUF342 family protein